MAKVIGVIQAKGGVGRSTIATNLAAFLAEEAPTCLIDCDLPQGTSASWGAIRNAEGRLGQLAIATVPEQAGLAARIAATGAPARLAVRRRAAPGLASAKARASTPCSRP